MTACFQTLQRSSGDADTCHDESWTRQHENQTSDEPDTSRAQDYNSQQHNLCNLVIQEKSGKCLYGRGVTNPGCQVVRAVNFVRWRLIFWASVWNFLYATHLAPIILNWFLDFWEICALLLRVSQCSEIRTDRQL